MSTTSISVIQAYHSRPKHLRNTLQSYAHWYKDLDFEVVIVDDSSYRKEELESVVKDFDFPIVTEYMDRRDRKARNPGVVMNRAAELASSPILAITNPENMHCGPVLSDALLRLNPDGFHHDGFYLVYACRTLKTIPPSFSEFINDIDSWTNWKEVGGWYQHSKKYSRLLHFMSVITKSDWDRLGGFDPIFDNGCSYEDNDFIEKILEDGITIKAIDDPFVAHQAHSRAHLDRQGLRRNYEVFRRKWGRDPREF